MLSLATGKTRRVFLAKRQAVLWTGISQSPLRLCRLYWGKSKSFQRMMMHCTRAMEHTIIASSSSSSYCLTVLKYHFLKSLLLESRHGTSRSLINHCSDKCYFFKNWKIYRDFLRVVFNPCVKLLWRNCLKLALPKLPTMKLESRRGGCCLPSEFSPAKSG